MFTVVDQHWPLTLMLVVFVPLTRMHYSRVSGLVLGDGGACSLGRLLLEGSGLVPGGCLVPEGGGGGIPACTEGDPLWTDRQV